MNQEPVVESSGIQAGSSRGRRGQEKPFCYPGFHSCCWRALENCGIIQRGAVGTPGSEVIPAPWKVLGVRGDHGISHPKLLSSERPGGSTEPTPAPGFGCSEGGKVLGAGIASSPEHSSCFCGYSEAPGAAPAPAEEFQSIPRRRSQREPIQAIPS